MIEFATVARPYAKALFELAEQKQQTERWQSGLAELAWLMQQPKVMDLMGATQTNADEKAKELLALLEGSDAAKSAEFQNFVHILAQEKRLAVLPEIYQQYQSYALAKNDAKEAVIYTAFDIADKGQRAKIISDLEQHFNIRLQATFKTDPDLIGGIKVEMGDQVLDLSVRSKLDTLYTTMTN